MGKKLEMAIGALNGAVGDYLVRTGNGLATAMSFVVDGAAVPLERDALARAYPEPSGRVVVLVHGLMCTEHVWDFADGGDYGAFLARDFGLTPLYLRFNTGLAIPDNGHALADALERLRQNWPVSLEEVLLVGYSMGGLVARSACHFASVEGLGWLPLVKRAIYVGTPHLGAPLERLGRVATKLLRRIPDPYTRLVADLGELRSDGIKDLGDADIRHEDRARREHRLSLRDPRHPVPLLPEIRHYLVAGTLSDAPLLADFFGDILVPLPSGTNRTAEIPANRVRVLSSIDHLTLAHHADVYAHIRAFCEEAP